MARRRRKTDIVVQEELDALGTFALMLRDLLQNAQQSGITRQEMESVLYEAMSRIGDGLGVRIHGLDQTQIAALKDYFYDRTGMNPAGLAGTEIYGRHGQRLLG